MQGTDRTLRPELGVGGRQTIRQISTPDGIVNEGIGEGNAPRTAVGGVDQPRDLDQPDVTPADIAAVAIEQAVAGKITADHFYAAVYDWNRERPGDPLLANGNVSDSPVAVKADGQKVIVDLALGHVSSGKDLHGELQLDRSNALRLALQLVQAATA